MNGFLINDKTKLWHSVRNPGMPQFIWYDFRVRRFSPARISFHPRRDRPNPKAQSLKEQTPTKFQFIGSNDAVCDRNSAWTVLCEDLSGEPVASRNENRECRVDGQQPEFRCLGLKILAVHRLYVGSGNFSTLSGIRIWAH